tara:strand:- start:902 stop:1273 length:372 start_codon:yes stop_codon:yes gene_type:complete
VQAGGMFNDDFDRQALGRELMDARIMLSKFIIDNDIQIHTREVISIMKEHSTVDLDVKKKYLAEYEIAERKFHHQWIDKILLIMSLAAMKEFVKQCHTSFKKYQFQIEWMVFRTDPKRQYKWD